MPITFDVAKKALEPFAEQKQRAAHKGSQESDIIKASPPPASGVHLPTHNGFVDCVVAAYNRHHHLILRPDDVWLAIICQFSAYMEKHAEALRDRFVAHKGQVQLEVRRAGSLFSAPYEEMTLEMTTKIAEKLKDATVRDWVLPSFSTTTPNDTLVGAIALMAAMKAYFQYKFSLCCGIPKVTLEGTVEDWEQIEARAARLLEFDNDKHYLRTWYAMLKDVLANFTLSAKGSPNVDWWQRVCSNLGGGSGPRYLSGWITVFCVFNDSGHFIGDTRSVPGNWGGTYECVDAKFAPEGWPVINTNDLPPGKVEAPLIVDDNGVEYKCKLVAGHSSMRGEGSSVQPWLSWTLLKAGEDAGKDQDPLGDSDCDM